MRPALPPLNALRAFEAAGRLGSFKEAAAELHVTHGAVSQQVRLLEEWLGASLFERHNRRVVLTPAARAYLAEIGPLVRAACAGHGPIWLARDGVANTVRECARDIHLALAGAEAGTNSAPRIPMWTSG